MRSYQAQHPEGVKTNTLGKGAYQSPMTLTKQPEIAPVFDFAIQMGMKAAFDLQFVDCDVHITAAWCNIASDESAMQYEHIHQDTFHGIFYLKVPKKEENQGKMILSNPAINPLWQGQMLSNRINKFTASKMRITPREGCIFLFPSHIPHGVEPTLTNDEERISIAFNLICIPKEYVQHTK